MTRFVMLSDTHIGGRGKLSDIKVPDGDVLLHAGDHTWTGVYEEVVTALDWLESLPHKHKYFVAGNHDFLFDESYPDGHQFRTWTIRRPESVADLLAKYPSIQYLQDQSAEVEGFKIYGAPWQPWYHNWAFQLPGGLKEPWNRYSEIKHDREGAAKIWAKIPDDTQILITHGPPLGIMDKADDLNKLGCPELANRIGDLKKLKLHLFGHIHEGYGHETMADFNNGDIVHFVNAAICNGSYYPVNKPIVVDL